MLNMAKTCLFVKTKPSPIFINSVSKTGKKTAEYLGDDFKTLVKEYVETVHSVFYDAGKYSWQFGDYIKDKAAFEVADIERKMAECFNIKNSPAATAANFEGLTPEEFMELKITPRSASFLEAYSDNRYMIIYRHEDKTFQLQLEEEEFIILSALKDGKNIGEALELLPENTDPAKIQNWFASWISNKIISTLN